MSFLTQRLGDDAFTSALTRTAIGETGTVNAVLSGAGQSGAWGTLTAITRQVAATSAPASTTSVPVMAAAAAAGVMSAGSTLTAGDIAIVSMNADTNKIFAFVTLVELDAGTVIKFTDNGWTSGGAFRTGEGIMTWTSSGVVAAGTVVTINTTATTSTASTGTVSDSGDANFSGSGDQILAYQGSEAAPTFLFAVNNEGSSVWQANAADSNTSALPTGLTNGTNAIALNEVDNAAYSGITSGTKAELLAAIVDPANWTRDDANNLTAPASFSVGGGTTPATVAIDDVTVTEGDAGTQILTFTVTRSNNTGTFSVDYATADGSAEAASDYVAASGTLSFTAGGALTQTISVTVNGDSDIELDESFTLGLSNIVDTIGTASFSDDTGTGTIANNDVPGAGEVSVSDITVTEGDGISTIEVTVTRSGGTAAFSVDFATADGTAVSSSDYDAATGTLNFAENELSKVISITLNGDTTFEGTTPEYFYVNLSGATGSATIADAQATVTIEDSDVPESTLVINEIDSDTPGTDAAEFVELFDGGAGNTSLAGYVVVFYNGSNDLSYAAFDLDGYTTDENGYFVLGNTAVPGVDLVFNGNLLQNGADAVALYYGDASSFPNNSGFGPLTTLIDAIVYDTDDTDDTGLLTGLGQTVQYNESAGAAPADHALARTPNGSGGFVAQAATPGASNDPTPVLTVAIAASTMSENGGVSTATVTRSGSTVGDVVVTLSSDDTTEATVPVTVTILDGQSSATFGVTAVDDLDFDGSSTVTITATADDHISATDTIVVTDDDAANVSIDDVAIVEGQDGTSTLTFTVTRSDNEGSFTLDYATADGTATSGSDYVATSGTLSFTAGGDLTQTISVTIHGDLEAETTEAFTVNLSNLASTEGGAVITDGAGTGTIQNDDLYFIHQIQGTAFFSPILADAGISSYNVQSVTTVTVEAVVTAIDNAGALQGFFLMEEQLDWDLDWHSSEGIFVMTRDDSNNGTEVGVAAAGLEVGEIVQVTAYIVEYQTFENLPRTFLTGATAIVQSNTITEVPTWVLDGSEGHAIPNGTLSDDNPDFTDSVDGVGDTFDAENDALDFFETIEGMHVTIPDMVVADGFVEGSNAEVRFKAYSEAHADADQINDRGGYTVGGDPLLSEPDTLETGDDVNYGGSTNTDGDINPDIVELDFSGAGIGGTAGYHNQLNMGDKLGDISGVIDFDFTEVKLYVTEGPSAEVVAELGGDPVQDVTTLTHDDRSLRVSTFNVENLAGTDAQGRFDAIAAAINDHLLAPDIICIEEVQDNNGTTNDGTVDASVTWNRLVEALNLATGKTYQWVDETPTDGAEGGAPGGNIRVGFLYDTARVQLGNLAADASIEERRAYTDRIGDGVRTDGDLIAYTDADVAGEINSADWTTTRKSLMGEFTFNGNTVYVTANHFPSKGGSDNFWELDQNNSNGNPTNSDWAQRNEVAEDVWSVLDFIADHDADARLIEGGDFNDFYFYRPLEVATGSVDADGVARGATETRLVNLTVSELAEGERYTYAFDGRSQAIDHILSDEELAAVADYDVVHLNTGYSERTGATNPAISDHDPTLARFDFRNFSEVLTGTAAGDLLEGFGGADYLLGGTGDDTMDGGLGNDTFTVDSADDVVLELNGEGTDTVIASVSYSLAGRFVEALMLTGSADLTATGNGLANTLTGNAGNNLLDGGSNADTMAGGLGNDTYVVGAASDVVSEGVGEGTDTVRSAIAYVLGANLENLILTGTADIKGTGNALDNVLTGNDGVNLLVGGLGDDTYYVQTVGDEVSEGYSGGTDLIIASISYSIAGKQIENLTLTGSDDLNATGSGLANILTGNSGNNLLDGGVGNDTMNGGAGNDTYVVNTSGDVVTEAPGQGTDTVLSAVTFTLGADVENVTLTGTGNIKATGNAAGNILTGNSGVNVLTGGLGDDTYYIQNETDRVVELTGEGNDLIVSTVSYSLYGRNAETLQLSGSDAINATGNSLTNILIGNTGSNVLNGMGGNDILTGGLGADIFLFSLGSRADTVTDFSAAEDDTIDISAYTLGVANTGLVSQIGGNTIINLGSGNIITVTGVNQADVLDHIVW